MKQEQLEYIKTIVDGLHYETKIDRLIILSKISHLYWDTIPTLEDIAFCCSLTKERVRKIEKAALKKLSHPKVACKLKKYSEDTYVEYYSILLEEYTKGM